MRTNIACKTILFFKIVWNPTLRFTAQVESMYWKCVQYEIQQRKYPPTSKYRVQVLNIPLHLKFWGEKQPSRQQIWERELIAMRYDGWRVCREKENLFMIECRVVDGNVYGAGRPKKQRPDIVVERLRYEGTRRHKKRKQTLFWRTLSWS